MGKLAQAKRVLLEQEGKEYIGKHGNKPRAHGKKVTAKRNARIVARKGGVENKC